MSDCILRFNSSKSRAEDPRDFYGLYCPLLHVIVYRELQKDGYRYVILSPDPTHARRRSALICAAMVVVVRTEQCVSFVQFDDALSVYW